MTTINEKLAARACTWTFVMGSKWHFQPVSMLKINKQVIPSACVGRLSYQHDLYEIGPAMKVGNYVFCLERLNARGFAMLPPDATWTDAWVIAAFNERIHYSFHIIPNDNRARDVFLAWIVTTILPIIAPNEFHIQLHSVLKISW